MTKKTKKTGKTFLYITFLLIFAPVFQKPTAALMVEW